VQQAQSLEIVPRYRYNETLDYKTFMLPAFIVLMITLICGILPSLNVVLEKEIGTIHQINTTPVTKLNFILAKVIPYWIIGIIILTISIFMVWIIYGLFPSGSILALYLSSIIFIVGVTALGIVISNYSDTLQQSMFIVLFFILIIILLSGMFTPVSSMPVWAQTIAYINPLTHFIEIMRLIYLKANSFIDLLRPMAILLAFAAVFNGWAVLSYKKSN
jgi:ABC-2 type transport system permease protein